VRALRASVTVLLFAGAAAATLPSRAPAPPLEVVLAVGPSAPPDPSAGADAVAAWSQAAWEADVARWNAAVDDNRRRADDAAARRRAARSSRGRSAGAILHCENRSGSYTAENPRSTASGRYQFVDGTFRATKAAREGGWTHAADAPPEVQDAAFAEVWNGGKGSHHWAECGG
jgi:hypothetical protein